MSKQDKSREQWFSPLTGDTYTTFHICFLLSFHFHSYPRHPLHFVKIYSISRGKCSPLFPSNGMLVANDAILVIFLTRWK